MLLRLQFLDILKNLSDFSPFLFVAERKIVFLRRKCETDSVFLSPDDSYGILKSFQQV